jgi:enoyl-CoA hydratase/carnithine racemase
MPGELKVDEPAEGVLRLVISNPAKHNALDHPILDAIAAQVSAAPDRGARALLLAGEDGMFSSGYDIADIPPGMFAREAERLVAHPFTAALDALAATDLPVVAALGGPAIGGGLELAVHCDLRLAAEHVQLGMPPARLGLVYSHTGLRRFLDVVGESRTRELFLLGRYVDAARAEAWGLVNEVVAAEELDATALDWAVTLAGNSPLSLSGNKRVLRALLAAEAELPADVEAELIALRRACFSSEDFAEGVRAFAEKREPRWPGR